MSPQYVDATQYNRFGKLYGSSFYLEIFNIQIHRVINFARYRVHDRILY